MVAQEPVVTFLVDSSGIITLAGDFDVSRLGLAHKVQSGNSIFELYEDTPQVILAIQQALHGEHVNLETSVNGFTFANSYSPLFDMHHIAQKLSEHYHITSFRSEELTILYPWNTWKSLLRHDRKFRRESFYRG